MYFSIYLLSPIFINIFLILYFLWKDKATLEESLELFVGEELFSGDNKLEDPDAGTYMHSYVLTHIHT